MAGMTKQHFETVARGIRMAPGLTEIQRKIQAESMATELQHTNPKFDRQKFIDSCMLWH